MRLVQLVRMTAVADQVTLIVDAGRPVAALVPADAAQTSAQARASAAHAQAVAAGWAQRLESVRGTLRGQHASQQREWQRALTEVWRLLDRLSPPGAERGVDALRAAHRDMLVADD